MAQIFPTDFEEKLTMAQDDYILFSDSEDGNKIKKAQYQNLKGEKGDTGARINSASFSGNDIVFGETDGNSVTLANAKTTLTGPKGEDGADGQDGAAATITVGNTTTGDAGTNASVTNSGTSSAAIFDFTIPKGDKGDTGATGSAATISVGSTTTGGAGTSASVVNSGTSSAAVLDFTIPKGDKGDTGNTGATGNGIASITSSKSGKVTTVTITETNGNSDSFTVEDGADGQGSGDVIGPASSTDGNVVLFNGATGKLIKDSGKTLPSVIDNLTSTSTTDALSANQGKELKDLIDTYTGLGRFLSLWNSATGQPISFPLDMPYTYNTGDWFMVEVVSSDNPPVNYMPNGSSYTGTASTTQDTTNNVEQRDVYIYDGTSWLFQKNNEIEVSFADIAGSPSDNTALSNALGAKQDSLTLPATPTQGHLVVRGADNETLADGGAVPTTPSKATSSALGTIKLGSDTVQSTSAEAVSGTANRTYAIQLNSSDQAVVNVPWENTTYSNLAAASGGTDVSLVTTGDKYNWDNKQSALVSGTNIKTVNGNSLLGSGDLSVGGITKVFTLSSTSDTTNAQAAYDWYKNGGNPILTMTGSSRKWRVAYVVAESGSSNTMCRFESGYATGTTSSWGQMIMSGLNLIISSSGSVISITTDSNQFVTSSTAPASGTTNNVITFVI